MSTRAKWIVAVALAIIAALALASAFQLRDARAAAVEHSSSPERDANETIAFLMDWPDVDV